MKLLDSNIVIYATKPGFEFLEATLASAATALAHGYDLVTRNVDDFKWISELSVIDPFPPSFTE